MDSGNRHVSKLSSKPSIFCPRWLVRGGARRRNRVLSALFDEIRSRLCVCHCEYRVPGYVSSSLRPMCAWAACMARRAAAAVPHAQHLCALSPLGLQPQHPRVLPRVPPSLRSLQLGRSLLA
eukprot:2037639-Pleurochrysis_carterae.AAC.1